MVEATCPTTETIDFAIVDVSTITGVLHFALDSTRFAGVCASSVQEENVSFIPVVSVFIYIIWTA